MLSYGLQFYKDDDVEEAVQIAKVMMANDDSDDDDDDDDDEMGLEGHFADHVFTDKQLDWIEAKYGNSMNFMLLNGLKFYDEDDLKAARILADGIAR